MNKVETVSIGGYAFTLDDAACAKVRSYIDSLNSHYSASSGGDEIVDGIEERFAELLLERLAGNSVASESDVEAVIAILGVPEAMEPESGTAEEIGRNISSGINELGEAAHRIGNSEAWPVVWRVMCVCIGLVLLLIGISGLFTGVGLALAGSIFKDLDILQGFDGWLSGSKVLSAMAANKWIVAMSALIYFIPFIGTSYLGLKMVFGFKSPKWKPGLTLFVLWLVILVATGVMIGIASGAHELIPDSLLSF